MIGEDGAGVDAPHAGRDECDGTPTSCAKGSKGMLAMGCAEKKLRMQPAKDDGTSNGAPHPCNAKSGGAWTGRRTCRRRATMATTIETGRGTHVCATAAAVLLVASCWLTHAAISENALCVRFPCLLHGGDIAEYGTLLEREPCMGESQRA
jgi:hypothetical protein